MSDIGQPDMRTPKVFRYEGKDYVAMDEYLRLGAQYRDFYSPQWIPVAERLPAEDVRCIIATRIPGRYVIDGQPKDGHEIEFGEWVGNRWRCFDFPGPSLLHPSMVSHWMPMPSLPEEER